MTKAEAAAKAAAAPDAKKKIEVPPMPAKPDYARPQSPVLPRQRRAASFLAAAVGCAVRLVAGAGVHVAGGDALDVAAGTARFMFPNILTEPPSRFKVGFPDNFAPGQVETKFIAAVRRVDRELRIQRPAADLRPARRSARTWAARRTGWKRSRNSNAPATAAVFTRTASTSKARPRGRWSATRSASADDGQFEVDKSRTFQEEMGQWDDPASFRAGVDSSRSQSRIVCDAS